MKTLSFLTQDWAIKPEGYLDLAKRMHNAEKAGVEKAEFDPSRYYHVRKEAYVDDSRIAHIHVFGPLMNNPEPWMHLWKDITSYDVLQAELKEVLGLYHTGDVKGLLIHLDTPGGMVAGVAETSEALRRVVSAMPVVGYSHELCCSAGYWLASTLGEGNLFSSPSADIGNIGAIIRYYDWTKYFEDWGIIPKAISNEGADLKSTWTFSDLTESQAEFLQERIDDCGERFQTHCLTHRPGLDVEVFRAGWYNGDRALEMGLCDYIGEKQDAYDTLLGRV